MLIAPSAAMAIIIIVAMAVGDSITRCWIPWCCGVFCGAVTAFFFWQTVNALLVASNAAFVCIAIDKENGVGEVSTSAEGGALYALVQGEIAEEVKALKEGGEEVPEFEAVAVTPKAAAGGAAEVTARPDAAAAADRARPTRPRRPATGLVLRAVRRPRVVEKTPSHPRHSSPTCASCLQVLLPHACVRTRRVFIPPCLNKSPEVYIYSERCDYYIQK